MHHDLVIQNLYQIGAIQFGNFTLKSGQPSNIYINLRKIIGYPTLMRSIAELMWQSVQPVNNDLICGVPYTALPIATCISIDHNIPMLIRRKEKKEYGTKQSLEGVYQPGQCCLIIEDVITTGSSIIETAKELTDAEIQVKEVVVLIDREQGGRENLEKHYSVTSLFTLSHIINYLLPTDLLTPSERESMLKYINR